MLGSLLDGIPENTALGVSLMEGGGVVLLVAVAVGNVPESVAGAASMRKQPGFDSRQAPRAKAISVAAGYKLAIRIQFRLSGVGSCHKRGTYNSGLTWR